MSTHFSTALRHSNIDAPLAPSAVGDRKRHVVRSGAGDKAGARAYCGQRRPDRGPDLGQARHPDCFCCTAAAHMRIGGATLHLFWPGGIAWQPRIWYRDGSSTIRVHGVASAQSDPPCADKGLPRDTAGQKRCNVAPPIRMCAAAVQQKQSGIAAPAPSQDLDLGASDRNMLALRPYLQRLIEPRGASGRRPPKGARGASMFECRSAVEKWVDIGCVFSRSVLRCRYPIRSISFIDPGAQV